MNNIQTTHSTKDRQYLHTFGAGALLPLMQASITAIVVSIGTWVIVWLVFDLIDPHKPALFVGIVVWMWQWWKLQGHWFALTAAEHITRTDLNGDGYIGAPDQVDVEDEAGPKVIRVQLSQIKNGGHYQQNTIDFPCDEDQLIALARGLNNGLPFSEKFWTGKGKPFSTDSFRALRDAMKVNALCEYINESEPRQGMQLTETGKALMKKLAVPHSPAEEEVEVNL